MGPSDSAVAFLSGREDLASRSIDLAGSGTRLPRAKFKVPRRASRTEVRDGSGLGVVMGFVIPRPLPSGPKLPDRPVVSEGVLGTMAGLRMVLELRVNRLFPRLVESSVSSPEELILVLDSAWGARTQCGGRGCLPPLHFSLEHGAHLAQGGIRAFSAGEGR
jgi:hypothetical protein